MTQPCKDCKGHQLTHGRCHGCGKCSRYQQYRGDMEKARADLKKSGEDAAQAGRYSR